MKFSMILVLMFKLAHNHGLQMRQQSEESAWSMLKKSRLK